MSWPGDKAYKQQRTENGNTYNAHIKIWGRNDPKKLAVTRRSKRRENLKTAVSCVLMNELFDEGKSGLSVKYRGGFCN